MTQDINPPPTHAERAARPIAIDPATIVFQQIHKSAQEILATFKTLQPAATKKETAQRKEQLGRNVGRFTPAVAAQIAARPSNVKLLIAVMSKAVEEIDLFLNKQCKDQDVYTLDAVRALMVIASLIIDKGYKSKLCPAAKEILKIGFDHARRDEANPADLEPYDITAKQASNAVSTFISQLKTQTRVEATTTAKSPATQPCL